MSRLGAQELMMNALRAGVAIPSFNTPYLPVMEPTVRAIVDTQCFAFITVARVEWTKFDAKGIQPVYDEYCKLKDEKYTRLHLDHIPVIDEDNLEVDYLPRIREAIELGYDSVMIDGSRLGLDENIAVVKKVVELAHVSGIPVEAELGAIFGHESGPLPPYEELFESGKGFTDPAEAKKFVEESGVDWLSVAVGNIHGAISAAKKSEKKVEARINIGQLDKIYQEVECPLVLHGGTGIKKNYIMESFKHGISKINIATATRQPYEKLLAETGSVEKAQDAVYAAAVHLIKDELELAGSADIINP